VEKSYFHAGDSGREQAVCRGGGGYLPAPIPAGSENGEAFWQHTLRAGVRGLQRGCRKFGGCAGGETVSVLPGARGRPAARVAAKNLPPCRYPAANAGSSTDGLLLSDAPMIRRPLGRVEGGGAITCGCASLEEHHGLVKPFADKAAKTLPSLTLPSCCSPAHAGEPPPERAPGLR